MRTSPNRRPRSSSGERRRPRSSSSHRYSRSDEDRIRQDRRILERRSNDRSKDRLIKQHEVLDELERRPDSNAPAHVDSNYRGTYARRNNEKNAWTYLVVSTSAVMASLVTSDVSLSPRFSIYGQAERNSSMYWTALSLCIVQLLLSLYRSIIMVRDQYRNISRSQPVITLAVAILVNIFQAVINSILLGKDNYFAMTGLSIINQNMFYGCWISFGLTSFLLGNAVASFMYTRGTAMEARFKSNSDNWSRRRHFGKLMTVLWTMHVLFQVCVLSSSISIQSSQICGGILRTTKSCQSVSTALILSVFNLPICMVCLLNVFSFLRLGDLLAIKLYCTCASLSLVIQTITTGILTTAGGLGTNPGNLFISTWMNTFLCLTIALRCIEGYLIVHLPSDGLEPTGVQTVEKVIGFSAQPRQHVAITRARSSRTSETPSTDISDDEEEVMIMPQIEQQQEALGSSGANMERSNRAPTHLLPLPAPEPNYASRPDPMHQQQVSMPPLPPRSLPREPHVTYGREPLPPPPRSNAGAGSGKGSRRSTSSSTLLRSIAPQPPPLPPPPQSSTSSEIGRRAPRSTFSSTLHRSIAPQPPPFREQPSTKAHPHVSNLSKMRSTFMEPISEKRGEDRQSSLDPPCSNPGSIQDAAYYHSSRDILLPLSDSDDAFVTNTVRGIASKGRTNARMLKSNSDSTFDKVRKSPHKIRASHDPSLAQPTVNSIGNDIASIGTKGASSVNLTQRKSKSPGAARNANKSTSTSYSDNSSVYFETKRRTDTGGFEKESEMSIGESWVPGQSDSEDSSAFGRRSAVANSRQASTKSSSAASGRNLISKRLVVDKEILAKMTSIEISDDSDVDLNENAVVTPSNGKFTASSSSRQSSARNIDDYIAPLPNVNPNALRSSLHQQLPRHSSSMTSKTASLTKPSLSREPSTRCIAKKNVSKHSSSTNFAPFISQEDHTSAVTAALFAARSTPSPSRRDRENTDASNHSSVTSHDDDDDSGVLTVSVISDYNSGDNQTTSKESPEKSRDAINFLDFEYRPRASGTNMNASRRQILSYFDPRQEAPMDIVRMNSGSLVSEPTLDNSIRTTRRSAAPQSSEVDATLRAALDRAALDKAMKSKKRMSIRMVNDARGDVDDVNDIVAAALQAASDRQKANATPLTGSPRRQSLSSNFSSIMMQQAFSGVSSDAMKKMRGDSSHTESGSFANC